MAGGEDLFCILNIHNTQLLNVLMRARVFRGCAWYLWVERDNQLHAVVSNEGRDVFLSQLPMLRPHKVYSALIKLAKTNR